MGIVFLLDGSNENKINLSKDYFNNMIRYIKNMNKPLLVLVNKCEDYSQISENDVIQILDLKKYKFEWNVMKINAFKEKCLEKAFEWINPRVIRQNKRGFLMISFYWTIFLFIIFAFLYLFSAIVDLF